MNLIVFAHKLEARHFFSNYTMKKHASINNLYEHQSFLLFISGMGKEAGENLLGVLNNIKEIEKVINMGIAGGLNPELTLHQIYPIKKCLNASKISCEIQTPGGVASLITSEWKVLTPDDAADISEIDLVDMESYSLFTACDEKEIPYHSYKLVSDFPLRGTSDQAVKSNFEVYSKLIFEYFENHILSSFLGV